MLRKLLKLNCNFLARVDPSSGDYTVYDGGFLCAPPGSKTEESNGRTDDQKATGRNIPRVHDRGHYLALIVGKGLNSKDTSKLARVYLHTCLRFRGLCILIFNFRS